jgi:hypothetical protein
MEQLKIINKTREYLNYLESHILNVKKAWEELQDKCKDMRFITDDFYYNWIDMEINSHDMSKFSEFEFVQYREFFYPSDSKNIVELTKSNFEKAWEHHEEKNQHHWQNFTSKDYANPCEWEVHCVHMIIDWMAMGYQMGDTAQMYYEKNKNVIMFPDYIINFIYEIFKRIE